MLLYIISLCYLLHCRSCFVMKWLTFPQAASLTAVNDFLRFPKSLLTTMRTQWVLTCYTLVTLSCGLCLQVVSMRLCIATLNNSQQRIVFWFIQECKLSNVSALASLINPGRRLIKKKKEISFHKSHFCQTFEQICALHRHKHTHGRERNGGRKKQTMVPFIFICWLIQRRVVGFENSGHASVCYVHWRADRDNGSGNCDRDGHQRQQHLQMSVLEKNTK